MRGSRSATLATDQSQHARKLTGPLMLRHILLLLGSLGTEETMKRHWQIYRTTVQSPDAHRRWDRAYQSILRWTLKTDQQCEPSMNAKEEEEEYHEGSGIRPSLDLPTGQAPDD